MEAITEQLSIFNETIDTYKITKPIRLIELFAGIGSQLKAIKQIFPNVESYKIVEWDYHSFGAYNLIHTKDFTNYSIGKRKDQLAYELIGLSRDGKSPLSLEQLSKMKLELLQKIYHDKVATKNLLNIMEVKGKDLEIVDTDKYEYIITYSFPCQDLSLSGNRKGMSVSQANGGTRSGLLWEVERILIELKDNKMELPQILLMENVPEVVGTKNINDFRKWEAKLRELGYSNFCEILNSENYGIAQNRKRCYMISILGKTNYHFLPKFNLDNRLKDYLEKEVDDKYFLSPKTFQSLVAIKGKWNREEKFVSSPTNTMVNGIAQTIKTKIDVGVVVKNYKNYISWKNKQGKFNTQCNRAMKQNGVSLTIPTSNIPNVIIDMEWLKIRCLTPKECMLLMGFEPQDYEVMKNVNMTDTQIYKCAGDSIVVSVLMAIFGRLKTDDPLINITKIKEYVAKNIKGE